MYYFTKEGLKKIKGYYSLLEENLKKDIKALNCEKETNLGESGSFLFARNQLIDRFKYESSEIKKKIQSAIIIENTPEYKNWSGDTVIRKCRVLVDFDGEQESFTILGSDEQDLDNNVITCHSALAVALHGHKVNDEIIFRGANIKILNIEPVEKVKKLTLENK